MLLEVGPDLFMRERLLAVKGGLAFLSDSRQMGILVELKRLTDQIPRLQ